MSKKIRQEQILQILKKQGYVTVRYLSDTLQYSVATINRDLNAMQRQGLIKRSYGGVEAETGACGTGSVAAAVIGVAQHGLRFPVHVKTVKGYDLTVDGEVHGGKFSSITLTGPVKKVYEGTLDWDSLDMMQE